MKNIKVLIVDDSPVSTTLLKLILEESPQISIIGCAKNGLEAVSMTQKLKPDLITMDIFMPKMDGVEATQRIMEQCPTPIIIITSRSQDAAAQKDIFNAMQAGALSVMAKPTDVLGDNFSDLKQEMIHTILALSQVHVMRRRKVKVSTIETPSQLMNPPKAQIIGLGSSTGGPEALYHILSALPAHFSLPIVITQHITKGFLQGLVQWLQSSSALAISIAEHQQPLLPGHVYFAADNFHLSIQKGETPIAILEDSLPFDHIKPSANIMFTALAKHYPHASIGGLLTGMGRDGAEGLLKMKEAGCVTFVQSEATSVIFGMPGSALAIDATKNIIDLEKIPEFLTILIDRAY